MAPVFKALRARPGEFSVKVCTTGQHRELLDQPLEVFGIEPDVDLGVMKPSQTLATLTSSIITDLTTVMEDINPSVVLVQGDTTTAFIGALTAFYLRIPVGHVEAGLRTNDIYSPFPEEANRRLCSVVAQLHFTPTQRASQALVRDNVDPASIHQTGNTVVDALVWGLSLIDGDVELRATLEGWFRSIPAGEAVMAGNSRLIMVTGHRRESFGEDFEAMAESIKALSKRFPDDAFVYPVHMNPNVREPIHRILGGLLNVFLIEPVSYSEMLFLLSKTYLILTDSGGIQEEAPTLEIPVLVMRKNTERPEGVEVGCSELVGTDCEKIVETASRLLSDRDRYQSMQVAENPYGDGRAAERIIEILSNEFGSPEPRAKG